MLRWSPSTDADDDDRERGSAALEFIVVGMLLLVPLVYLIASLGMIQEQSLGAQAGARHIARALSTAENADTGARRADLILQSVIEEYALDADRVELSLRCRPAGRACPEAGATLVVTVSTRVALPLMPPVLGLDRMAAIPLEATAVQKVSRFWESE